jgi:2-dehydro-3-deoxygluconokinase
MAGSRIDLITLGEAMIGFVPSGPHAFRRSTSVERFTAGAEANVAVGVSRLGLATQYVGLVGNDLAGEAVLDDLTAEGVDTSHIGVHPTAHTGLLTRETPPLGQPRVGYARSGSAGSHLDVAHLDGVDFAGAAMVHVSGITAALGEGPRQAAITALSRVKAAGGVASCDLNYRAGLWSREAAAPVLLELATHGDIVFGSDDEWLMVAGTRDVASHPLAHDRTLIVTSGSGDIHCFVNGHDLVQPSRPATVVDVVGAGDAFVAGVLAARLAGDDWPDALAQGAYCGARVVSALGDWTNLPWGVGGKTAIPGHEEEVRR